MVVGFSAVRPAEAAPTYAAYARASAQLTHLYFSIPTERMRLEVLEDRLPLNMTGLAKSGPLELAGRWD